MNARNISYSRLNGVYGSFRWGCNICSLHNVERLMARYIATWHRTSTGSIMREEVMTLVPQDLDVIASICEMSFKHGLPGWEIQDVDDFDHMADVDTV